MLLPRLHLFELEDQPWFPAVLRQGMTDYLAEITARTRPYAPVVEPLKRLLQARPGYRIVDLCSGGGGPWPESAPQILGPEGATSLTLTDAFPNVSALGRFPSTLPVRYEPDSRSAHGAVPEPSTIRTLFSSFHHFAPADAAAILQAAHDAQTPIAVFEATTRSPKAIVAMAVVPFAVLVLTPLIRPRRWWRWLFTYLLPLIPVCAWWDGVVSCLRTYSVEELRAMASARSLNGFEWEVGELRAPGAPLPVTYVIGAPRRL